MDKIEIHPTADGQFAWRRVAPNGEILSDGETHRDRTDAKRAAARANPDALESQFVDVDA